MAHLSSSSSFLIHLFPQIQNWQGTTRWREAEAADDLGLHIAAATSFPLAGARRPRLPLLAHWELPWFPTSDSIDRGVHLRSVASPHHSGLDLADALLVLCVSKGLRLCSCEARFVSGGVRICIAGPQQ
jgi:hypothetical protein